MQNEPNKNVRRKCADLAAEVARNLTDEDGNNLWPEFLKFLFAMASNPAPEVKEVALHMFASVPGVFGNQEQQYIEVIKNMLASLDCHFCSSSCSCLCPHHYKVGLLRVDKMSV